MEIEWDKKAFKELRKIKDKKLQEKIYDAVSNLVNFSQCRHVKKIKGSENIYRLRIGDWRVIFTVLEEKIIIKGVIRRDEGTYRGVSNY